VERAPARSSDERSTPRARDNGRERLAALEEEGARLRERRRYNRRADGGYWYESGTLLITDDGHRIENWPRQHYENGTNKNLRTGKRFKLVVRILKRLRDEMEERGGLGWPVPSFLIESLV
jgi:hypothetical protein